LKAWQEIAYGRDIRQCLRTHRSGHRQRTQLASLEVPERRRQNIERGLYLPAEQINEHRRRAAIVHMEQIDIESHLEQLDGDMSGGGPAERSDADLGRVGPGVGDELRNRIDRNRWMYLQDERKAVQAGDHHDVADEVEVQLFVERCVERIRAGDRK